VAEASGRRLLLRALVASLCATALLAIAGLLIGEFGATQGRILLTTALISAYSLLALPGGVLLDQGRVVGLAWTLLALVTVAFLISMELIWVEWDDASDVTWKSLVVVTAGAAALSQIAASSSRARPDDPRSVTVIFRISIGAVLVLAVLVSVAALADIGESGYYRALGAVAVADLLLVVLQPVVRRMARENGAEMFRVVCLVEREGTRHEVEREQPGREFAAAAAAVIRELERDGDRVLRLERR
jgi:hypothetical protein